jgi:hypothetical protein
MSGPLEFANKMHRFANELQTAPRTIVGAGALQVKKSVQLQLAAAGAGSGRLRGAGRKGARIGVRYELYPTLAKVFMFGPAHLLESDTKAHRIPRATQGRRGRRNTKLIVIPGVGVRAWARHPGTRGKHPWRKGVNAALPDIGRQSQIHLHNTMVKALR